MTSSILRIVFVLMGLSLTAATGAFAENGDNILGKYVNPDGTRIVEV